MTKVCHVPEGKQEREEKKEQGMKLGPRKMDSFGPSDVLGRRPGSGSIRSSLLCRRGVLNPL